MRGENSTKCIMMKKNKYPDAIHRGTELNVSSRMSYTVIPPPPQKKNRCRHTRWDESVENAKTADILVCRHAYERLYPS